MRIYSTDIYYMPNTRLGAVETKWKKKCVLTPPTAQNGPAKEIGEIQQVIINEQSSASAT